MRLNFTKLVLFCIWLTSVGGYSFGQNVGIGTASPTEKLHVAGGLRVDDLTIPTAVSATTDKVVWTDANGKLYAFPSGTPGKILGLNGAGMLDWLDPGLPNTLPNGQIWIGNISGLPQPQAMNGDVIIDNIGTTTIQDNAVDGTDISLIGEVNGAMMYYDGTDWVPLPPGTSGQVMVVGPGGVPQWTNLAALITSGDLVSGSSAISVTNGVGAVLGTGTTVTVADNALGQSGVVAAPTGANANQVWGTDGSGNPAWVNAVSTMTPSDVVSGSTALTVTNGTGQTVGAGNVTVTVADNALGQSGVVAAPTGANANQVWGTDGSGNPAWVNAVSTMTPSDVVSGSTALTVTNGTGQTVGAGNVTVTVADNALGQSGVVAAPTGANANQVWGTDGSGNPAWIDPTASVDVENGLYYNAIAGKVRQGGTLVENTIITLGAFSYTHNISGAGLFEARNGATVGSGLLVNSSNNVGIGAATPSHKLHIGGVSNTERIEGIGTGGTFLVAPSAATDRVMFADAQGVVKAMPNGANGSLLTINNSGVPSWQGFNAMVDNGLYFNVGAGRIRQGGALVENTTITGAGFNYTHDLTGAGDFIVTEASSGTSSLFVKGNDGATTDGFVGVGINAPTNRLHINHNAATTAATIGSYPFAIGFSNGTPDYTIGSNANFGYEQTWNNKPLLINSQGNFVGINLATAPIQNLDINGRLVVRSGVIQRGTTQITTTSDLGLYSQPLGDWIRIASNGGAIKFFHDQGGANSAGGNAIMNIDNANGGGVAIGANTGGATNPNPSSKAVLDAQSTTKGMHIPRMTTAQRDAIAPGANQNEGLIIYNTTNDCVEFWDTKPTTTPVNGFWNSMCKWCEDVYVYSSNSNGNNFHTQAGNPNRPKKWCVYVNSGVTLGAGGVSATALSFASLPAGSTVYLFNYGSIIGGGGNAGGGGQERDAFCGGDTPGGSGAVGGDAIATSSTVQVSIMNYGLIGGGGGGGGGGAGGCRSNGGGGGGGAGIAAGGGGGGNNGGQKACNFLCLSCCGAPASNPGGAGSAFGGGTGGCSNGNSGGGCSFSGSNGGCGGNGGALGVGGASGTGTTCGTLLGGAQFGVGGPPGQALRGNGSGSYLTNSGGTVFGISTP